MKDDDTDLRAAMGRHLDELEPATPIEHIRQRARRGKLLVATSMVATVVLIGASAFFVLARSPQTQREQVVAPGPAAEDGLIAFNVQSQNDPMPWIATVPASGGKTTRLREGSHPSWSPDGSRIAFSCYPGICTMEADGSDVRTLTTPPEGRLDEDPDWGPGGFIAFTRAHSAGRDIFMVRAEGGAATPLIQDENNFDPAWSPDGQTIAFLRGIGPGLEAPDGGFQLWRMDSDGSGLEQLTEGEEPRAGDVGRPDWSPDGHTILFDQAAALWTIPATGGEPTKLPVVSGESFDVAAFPSWAPDSRRFVYMCSTDGSSGNDICLAEVGSADSSALVATDANEASPAWQLAAVAKEIAEGEETCDAPPFQPTYLPWVGSADVPAPEQSSAPKGDGVNLTWAKDGDFPPFYVQLSLETFHGGLMGEPSGVVLHGVEGDLDIRAGGELTIAWREDRSECNYLSLDLVTSGDLSLDEAKSEITKVARSLEPVAASEEEGVTPWDKVVMAFGSDGDILLALSDGSVVNVTQSPEAESSPTISFDDKVLVYEREGRLVYLRLDTGESAEFADGYSPAFGPLDYLAWDSGAGEVVVGSPFSDWTIRKPNLSGGRGATSFSFAWDQSLELLHYSIAVGHGVSPHYIDIVRVDGWECAACGGGLKLGRVQSLKPDDGTKGEFLSTSFGTSVDVIRVCCREGDTDAWETAEIGGLAPFDTGTVYNRIRRLDDVPLDLSGGLLGLSHAGSLTATVDGNEVDWRTMNSMAWFVLSGSELWLVAEGREPVRLPFKVTGGVAVAPTFAGSTLIHSF